MGPEVLVPIILGGLLVTGFAVVKFKNRNKTQHNPYNRTNRVYNFKLEGGKKSRRR